ncbi:MFS transporter [Oceanobacillus sp. CF4.6]|uniref:MFS transporter n=1 Tax=Oceanobacillus sp. CF4.6 TaxID=3373080 RepID=UPI003EE6F229
MKQLPITKKGIIQPDYSNVLSKTTKIFLSIICLNGVANSLSSIFINVYLYKLSQDFYEVALFNFISYLIWAPTFVFAGWLSKKTDRRNGLIIGGILQLLFYIVLLLLGSSASTNIILLGLIFGAGSGFYWMSVNTLSVDLTNQTNRDWFNGVNGIFSAFSQMIGPITAGWIITAQPGFSGYQLIFTLTFILFLSSLSITFSLPKYVDKGTFNWKALWNINKNVEWRHLSKVFSSLAFRDGVLSFAVWIWVYMVTGSEGSLGNYVFYTTTISIITYYMIGKFIDQKNRGRYIMIGTIGVSLAVFGLVLDVNFVTLLFYGFAAGICIPLFEVPFNTLSLNTIAKFDNRGKNRIEMVVSRELALSAGRIPSVGGLMLIYTIEENQNLWVASYLLIVIFIGLLSLHFLRNYRRNIIG